MAANIRLITVIAEPLLAPLRHGLRDKRLKVRVGWGGEDADVEADCGVGADAF